MKRKTSNKTAAMIYFFAALIFLILFFKDKNKSMLVFALLFNTLGFTFLAKEAKDKK